MLPQPKIPTANRRARALAPGRQNNRFRQISIIRKNPLPRTHLILTPLPALSPQGAWESAPTCQCTAIAPYPTLHPFLLSLAHASRLFPAAPKDNPGPAFASRPAQRRRVPTTRGGDSSGLEILQCPLFGTGGPVEIPSIQRKGCLNSHQKFTHDIYARQDCKATEYVPYRE